MPDQYTRTRAQLGTPALDVLRRAHVAVFGIGGVGGQAVEVLARVTASLFGEQPVQMPHVYARGARYVLGGYVEHVVVSHELYRRAHMPVARRGALAGTHARRRRAQQKRAQCTASQQLALARVVLLV